MPTPASSKSRQRSDQLAALVELLRCIPSHPYVITAETAHRQLAVAGHVRTLRSVQRQLTMLAEALPYDLYVNQDAKPYQYRWVSENKGWRLPALTPHESLLLTLAHRHLEQLLPRHTVDSLASYFDQARYKIHHTGTAEQQRSWTRKTRRIDTSQPLQPPTIPPGVFEAVSDALYRDCWLNITYRNANGHENDYDVMPLGLVQQGPRLYLACRYRGYDNERSLALHRILKATTSGLSFDPPPDFNLDHYIAHGRFSHGNGEQVRLSFSITRDSGQHLLESRLSEDQEVEDVENGYRITATVVNSILLKRWLLGFGDEVWDVEMGKSNNPEDSASASTCSGQS